MNSRLYVQTGVQYGRTCLEDVFFTAPYKVMRPFQRGTGLDIMVMMASAGLLGGDRLEARYHLKEGSDVHIGTQGYEKVFNTENACAQKEMTLTAEADTRVCFLPYPVIPFQGSDYHSAMHVELDASSTFFYGDVFTCGRTGMGEYFQMKCLESKLDVRVDGKLVFADHMRICPSQMNYTGLGQWQDFTHNGLFYAYLPNAQKETEFLQKARVLAGQMLPHGLAGASRARRGVCVRALEKSGDAIFLYFQALCKAA